MARKHPQESPMKITARTISGTFSSLSEPPINLLLFDTDAYLSSFFTLRLKKTFDGKHIF